MIGVNLVSLNAFLTEAVAYPGAEEAGLPRWLPACFHFGCIAIFASLLFSHRHVTGRRADSPPFFAALKAGKARFRAQHSMLTYTLLTMPFTFLPTSTLSYHLHFAGFFREPPAAVYVILWKINRIVYRSMAVLFFAYYALICALTRSQQIAASLSWIPLCASINVVLLIMSHPVRRKHIRESLFPQQVLDERTIASRSVLVSW